MRAVWKFPLALTADPQILEAPGLEWPLHLDRQGDQLCLWCEVDTEMRPRRIAVQVYGTGHPIPRFDSYIGSIVDDPYVWHLYGERIPQA